MSGNNQHTNDDLNSNFDFFESEDGDAASEFLSRILNDLEKDDIDHT